MDRRDRSRSKAPSTTSMAALADAAAAGEGAHEAVPPPPPPQHGEEGSRPPANLVAAVPLSVAAAAASGSSSAAAGRKGGAGCAASGGGRPVCQADGCRVDLLTYEKKSYNRRHKVCEAHSKSPVVLVAGLRQRFCQQCSRFHELSEFDDDKRSCRLRLVGHNERRRKSSRGGGSGGDGCRHADQDGRKGNPPMSNFQIR
ncbi:hypothetical protein ACP4OV_029526 [Aristida adscensionis]